MVKILKRKIGLVGSPPVTSVDSGRSRRSPSHHPTKLDQFPRNPDTAVMRDIETGRRRWYQFSVGTLMLAITLSAVALSSVPLIGAGGGVSLAVYILALLAVRIRWGYDQGNLIAMLGTPILVWLGCPWISAVLHLRPLLDLGLSIFIGAPVGFFCFLLVHAAYCLVVGERLRLPQDTTERNGCPRAGP